MHAGPFFHQRPRGPCKVGGWCWRSWCHCQGLLLGNPRCLLEHEVWQESPIQLLLPGAHQHFHPRLHHQGQNGNDLEAVTTITKARWDQPNAPLTSGCPLHSESSLSLCHTFSQYKDKHKQSQPQWSSVSSSTPVYPVKDVPWGQRSVPRMIPSWYGAEQSQSSSSTAVPLSGTGGQEAGPRVFLEDPWGCPFTIKFCSWQDQEGSCNFRDPVGPQQPQLYLPPGDEPGVPPLTVWTSHVCPLQVQVGAHS